MKLIGCGDSWVWGDELVDPIEEPIPIMNIPGGGFDRHLKPVNQTYRMKHRYINLFKDMIGAETLVDLSQCSISNDAIVRKLINYLVNEGYTSGRDTSDLFISIGWTSPERTEFFYKEKWRADNWIEFGPWSFARDHGNTDIDKFFKIYFQNFFNFGEFIHRWILQIWQTELMLKKYNIKYVMHQAFYHHHNKILQEWRDEIYFDNMSEHITNADKKMWDSIDDVRFMHKNDKEIGTAHHYMLSRVNNDPTKCFEVMHPNAIGHKIWAEHLFEYCKEHNLL